MTGSLSRRRHAVALALASVSVVAVAACSTSSSPKSSSSSSPGSAGAAVSMSALIAGSKQEHGLVMYTNGNLPQGEGGGAGVAEVIKVFKGKYPWITVSATDDEDPVVFSKFAAQRATGVRTADILLVSSPALWVGAVKNGYIQQFTPTGLSNFPSFVNQGHGLYVFSADPAITLYNKQDLGGGRPPSTIAGIVADAKAGKYKIGTYTVTNQFGYSAFWAYVHHSGWGPVDQLGSAVASVGDGGVLGQDVLQGGLGVAVFESGVARGVITHIPAQAKLAGYQYATDFTPLIPRGWGITANAVSPNSAKLFMDFVYSNEGQAAMCTAGYEVMSSYTPPGCQDTLTQLYQAVGGQQNTYLTPFTAEVADQGPFIARWKKAFHQ